jgi:hypothetical protein
LLAEDPITLVDDESIEEIAKDCEETCRKSREKEFVRFAILI